MTITEFLEARISEDEAIAQRATEGPWRYNPGKVWHTDLGKLAAARMGNPFVTGGQEFVAAGPDDGRNETTLGICTTGPEDNPESMADAAHIARHDPARVLAECAAKRAIIAMYEQEDEAKGWDPEAYIASTVFDAMRALAAVYKDHPDYQQEWA